MSKVHFYNKNRHTIMSFSDFTFQINEPDFPDYISFQIDVKYGFISASMRTECLVVDLVNFINHLQKLYRLEERKISFLQTIEKNIEINFDLNELGHIEIQVILHNPMDKILLQFKYAIDQSFLPELIGEISTVLKGVIFI